MQSQPLSVWIVKFHCLENFRYLKPDATGHPPRGTLGRLSTSGPVKAPSSRSVARAALRTRETQGCPRGTKTPPRRPRARTMDPSEERLAKKTRPRQPRFGGSPAAKTMSSSWENRGKKTLHRQPRMESPSSDDNVIIVGETLREDTAQGASVGEYQGARTMSS